VRVLGIEGTAWAASASVFDTDTDEIHIESEAYQPASGGIHPREASEHMGAAIPRVVGQVLGHARQASDRDPPIDAVAFSRGPGLGPCLRIVGTAARAIAGSLDVPLVGVNHMVAHLEIGRHLSGFDSPVCLNASGANAHLLGYHNGRYRVLGETMDTGVGNALDKFTRHVGWSHPGGPKVEEAASEGDYLGLPYVVKGMDFSFSGITSAAEEAYDDGAEVADVCCGLQETVFAMLTEVAERALSLTGTDELVLGGGVGQNARLREMLREMCEARGVEFFAPEARFLRDNGGMIAVLGAKMHAAGDTVSIEESTVDPNFRPDEVPVTWRSGERSVARRPSGDGEEVRGAEATVQLTGERVVKRRLPKGYRHPVLDERIRRERTVAEARLLSEARRVGVPTPLVRDVDVQEATLTLQRVGEADLAARLTVDAVGRVGSHLATLHDAGIVHGDPTTRNVRVGLSKVFLVDFGLGFHTGHVEDHAMDLHVFGQSVAGTAETPDRLISTFEASYLDEGGEAAEGVVERLRGIEGRGRYQ
jgi:N6-L-threonylcarbamoyladenine synthase/protein kinase Bud32